MKPYLLKELLHKIDRILNFQQENRPNVEVLTAIKPLNAKDYQFIVTLESELRILLEERDISIQQVSMRLGVSTLLLKDKINAYYGLTFKQYLKRFRLKAALEMLRNRSGNISEIAWKCGFNSLSYFCTCYRQYYGNSPGDELNER